jgi:acetylglutamate kinase
MPPSCPWTCPWNRSIEWPIHTGGGTCLEDGVSSPPIVVKIGGSTLGNHDTSLKDLVTLQKEGVDVVVVHGGGPVISQWMQRQGIPPRFVNGLRVTDAPSLDIVVAVLTGLINKQLVCLLHQLGGRALGISGVDGGLVEAYIANPDLGFVGEVTRVEPGPIKAILNCGFIPMMAPVAMHRHDGSHHAGNPLNINGDTVAGEVARALGAERLIFLTDVPGIMDGGGRVMTHLDMRRASLLRQSGVVSGGMIPKLDACLRALDRAQVAEIIDGRQPGSLLDCVRGLRTGTRIVSHL